MKLRAGLTGGIGVGKSEVARIFSDLGALVIDADEMARLAVAPGSEGIGQIRARWPAVVNEDGILDRAALAAIVFGDESARAELEAITHPIVRRLSAEREAKAGDDRIVIHDIPLLFESGGEGDFDAAILVIAPLELRIDRVQARNKVSRDKVEHRIAAQIDPEEAKRRADFVIENDGSFEHLRSQTQSVYDELLRRSRTRSAS